MNNAFKIITVLIVVVVVVCFSRSPRNCNRHEFVGASLPNINSFQDYSHSAVSISRDLNIIIEKAAKSMFEERINLLVEKDISEVAYERRLKWLIDYSIKERRIDEHSIQLISIVCHSAVSNLWSVYYLSEGVNMRSIMGDEMPSSRGLRFVDVVNNEAVFKNRAGKIFFEPILSEYAPRCFVIDELFREQVWRNTPEPQETEAQKVWQLREDAFYKDILDVLKVPGGRAESGRANELEGATNIVERVEGEKSPQVSEPPTPKP